MSLNIFSNGTLANADEVDDNFSFLTKSIIQNGIQGSLLSDNFTYNHLGTDVASGSLNFSYTTGSYVNQGSVLGSLVFSNLLTPKQKNSIGTIRKACVWVNFQDTGSLVDYISNPSFETVVGSGTFTGWTTTLVQPTSGLITVGSNKTYVTDGSISIGLTGSSTSHNIQKVDIEPSVNIVTGKQIGRAHV